MKIKISRRGAKKTIHWLDLILTYGQKDLENERLELVDEAGQIRKILSNNSEKACIIKSCALSLER